MSNTIVAHSIRNEIRENLSLSIPLISAQLVYACSGFVATVLVAKLGEDALAASVLVSMTWVTLHMLFFGILNAVSVLVSHQYGAQNDTAISRIMGQAFLFGLFVMVMLVACLLALPYVLRLSTQPPAVLQFADAYTYSLIWTAPWLVILVICEQFLAGVNRTKMVLRISLLVVPIEIPLIYLFMFGKLGFPKCGIAGIGYGFAITYTVTALYLIWYLLRSRSFRHLGIFRSLLQWHPTYLKELLRVGLPMGFMHVIEIGAFTVATFWIAHFGTTMVAAHQITIQFLSFVITMVFAMSQAVTIRVGQGVGTQNRDIVRSAAYVGILMSFAVVICVSLGFILIPEFFVRIDLNIHDPANAALLKDTNALLAICGVLLVFDNFRLIGFGALRALKDTRFAMYASLFSFWVVGLSLTYYLGFSLKFEGRGIWWGLTLGIITGAVLIFIRMRHLMRTADLHKVFSIKA